jgi:hypothetical protein
MEKIRHIYVESSAPEILNSNGEFFPSKALKRSLIVFEGKPINYNF